MATTVSALGSAFAVSVVPSSGSSAISTGVPPTADLLADIEHRRFVALAFADDDGAVDGKIVERVAHGFDGGVVGGAFVAAADLARRLNGGRFRDTHRFESELAVHGLGHWVGS